MRRGECCEFTAHENTIAQNALGLRRVNSLSVNPINDNFLSGGDDGTVLMWDIRAQNARVGAFPS